MQLKSSIRKYLERHNELVDKVLFSMFVRFEKAIVSLVRHALFIFDYENGVTVV